jgi:hypothetical protein
MANAQITACRRSVSHAARSRPRFTPHTVKRTLVAGAGARLCGVMDERAPDAARTAAAELLDWPRLARIAVRVSAWGVTQADVEHALYKAEMQPARNGWEFAEPERLTGMPCPIDVRNPDPTTIAADAGYHWAYAVHVLTADRSAP